MRKLIPFLVVIALSLSIVSCQKKEEKKTVEVKMYPLIEKASWIIGSWGNTTKEGDLTETWTQLNDSILKGISFVQSGKDTLFTEHIEIIQKQNELFYNPRISNQNEGKMVSFKLTSSTEKELVFENPTHDFPQKITYTHISNDSLMAEISGKKDGKEEKESYPMKKK